MTEKSGACKNASGHKAEHKQMTCETASKLFVVTGHQAGADQ
jgi:hypothetical protein